MGQIVSIHEYELKLGIDPAAFEAAIRRAESAGLLQLPGLVAHYFVKGLKGGAAGPTPRCGSTRAENRGSGCGVTRTSRGPSQTTQTIGRYGRRRFSRRSLSNTPICSDSRPTKSWALGILSVVLTRSPDPPAGAAMAGS